MRRVPQLVSSWHTIRTCTLQRRTFVDAADINKAAAMVELASRVVSGDRRALSQAITLVESTRPDHRKQSNLLLQSALQQWDVKRRQSSKEPVSVSAPAIAPDSPAASSGSERRPLTSSWSSSPPSVGASSSSSAGGPTHRRREWSSGSFRVGISGPPGVGKSTFIESLGGYLLEAGHSVAVLSIDPSSQRSGGSILGDKTRMEQLARHPRAYVRPSPSRCTLGGVAQDTAEAAVLCECAGYDTVLVETVGVGQSEVSVSEVADMVLLLVAPAGGDELQGMKKGIVEMADLVIVNKADGDLLPTARHTKVDYMHALQLVARQPHEWKPTVLLCSSVGSEKQSQLHRVWDTVLQYESFMQRSGQLEARRAKHRQAWMWTQLQEELLVRLRTNSEVQTTLQQVQDQLARNTVTSRAAANIVLDAFLKTNAQM